MWPFLRSLSWNLSSKLKNWNWWIQYLELNLKKLRCSNKTNFLNILEVPEFESELKIENFKIVEPICCTKLQKVMLFILNLFSKCFLWGWIQIWAQNSKIQNDRHNVNVKIDTIYLKPTFWTFLRSLNLNPSSKFSNSSYFMKMKNIQLPRYFKVCEYCNCLYN